jgi:hypothetical protein
MTTRSMVCDVGHRAERTNLLSDDYRRTHERPSGLRHRGPLPPTTRWLLMRLTPIILATACAATVGAASTLAATHVGPAASQFAVTSDTARQGPPWCLADIEPTEALLVVNKVRNIASASDSAGAAQRDSLGFLPLTSREQVVAVKDEQLCRRASRSLDQELFTSARGIAVHLTRVGSWYAIYTAGVMTGEFTYMVWVDDRWRVKAVSTF